MRLTWLAPLSIASAGAVMLALAAGQPHAPVHAEA